MKPSSLWILVSKEASTKRHVNIVRSGGILMKVRRVPLKYKYSERQPVTRSMNEMYN